jgi:nicotinamide-nucleotide amidase
LYSSADETLDSVAARLLIENNITVSTAESCTGGLIGQTLTNFPGISKVYAGGAVTYSNEAKVKSLGVREETLAKYGAVSSQTAREMAEGIRERLGTDISVSITGIAGPDGGTAEKPVGLVYIALASEKGTITKELRLWGNRNRIRSVTALYVFDLIRRHILGMELS